MSNADLTLESASSPSTAVALPSFGGGGFDALRYRAGAFLRQPAVARALPMIGMIAVVAIAALAWMALRQPPQRDLFRGLPDSDKAAVAGQLDKSGIKYNFDQSSGAITVSEDDYFKAKMNLASAGLPKSAPDGETLIDNLPMGASRAVEGEKLRSAREMDLARTIEAIDSVQSARVHLAVEAPSIFLRDQTKPSASVMLRLADGRSLAQAQVNAIVHLVASSVPGLAPEDVSVVDQSGHLLSNSSGDDGETDRQLSVQNQIEERYRQSVTSLLTPILGAGKFSVETHAELNFAQRQATTESFPQDQARLRSEQGTWQADPNAPGGGTAGGIPGALSNTPPPAGTVQNQTQANAAFQAQNGAAGAAPANGQPAATPTPGVPNSALPGAPQVKTQETFNRDFALGHEVAVTKDAVGTVKRLSIAVAIDTANGKPRTPAEIAAIETLVKGAIGFDQSRGDVVALTSRAFVPMTETKANWYDASWVSMLARNLSALLVATVLLLGIGRPLMKRWSAAKAENDAARAEVRSKLGSEIGAELSRFGGAPQPTGTVTLDMISSTQGYNDRAALIRDFVKQDPDRAALVVRDLLKEGKRENA